MCLSNGGESDTNRCDGTVVMADCDKKDSKQVFGIVGSNIVSFECYVNGYGYFAYLSTVPFNCNLYTNPRDGAEADVADVYLGNDANVPSSTWVAVPAKATKDVLNFPPILTKGGRQRTLGHLTVDLDPESLQFVASDNSHGHFVLNENVLTQEQCDTVKVRAFSAKDYLSAFLFSFFGSLRAVFPFF